MKQKGGKMSFADFLDVMHIHSSKESIPKELLDAFKGSDPGNRGVIPAKDLWNILTKWGEKISPREGEFYFFYENRLQYFLSYFCLK